MSVRREDRLDVSTVVAKAPDDGMAAGRMVRELTRDDRTGGDHLLVEYPAGWVHAEAGHVSAGQDIYVIEGELVIGSHRLITGCYVYIPEGVMFGPMASPTGARALVFHNKAHRFQRAAQSAPGADEQAWIGPVETWSIPWKDPMTDIVKKSTYLDPATGKGARPAGVLTKTLRHDQKPNSREMVALTSLAPGFIDPGTEHHPHDECLYLLAGDAYIGLTYDHKGIDRKEDLVLHKDHYISRPPGIRHGPVCTQTGALWLLYMNDMYTGIYNEVPGWQEKVRRYFTTARYK